MARKIKTKIWISQEQKEHLIWDKKAFFIVFKELSLKQIKPTFLKGESPVLISR